MAAIIVLIGSFFALTTDTLTQEVNCGTALVPRDTDASLVDTGDLAADDFRAEVVRSECAQRLLRNRIVSVALGAVGAVLLVLAARAKSAPPRFPGDPIV